MALDSAALSDASGIPTTAAQLQQATHEAVLAIADGAGGADEFDLIVRIDDEIALEVAIEPPATPETVATDLRGMYCPAQVGACDVNRAPAGAAGRSLAEVVPFSITRSYTDTSAVAAADADADEAALAGGSEVISAKTVELKAEATLAGAVDGAAATAVEDDVASSVAATCQAQLGCRVGAT